MPKYIAIMRYFDECTAEEDMMPENEQIKIFHADEQECLWGKVDMARRECICIEVEYFHYECGAYVKGA